jgi:hypothetical protein
VSLPTRWASILHRNRLAGDHGFVDRASALAHDAVDRHLLAGPHPQAVARLDAVERHVLLAAVVAQAPGRLGREPQQGLDGVGGLAARLELQDLAQQHQGDDHRGGFEIDRDRAVGGPECIGKDARRDSGRQAVEVGDAGAEADQGEHVEAAIHDRSPAALEEREATPKDDRRRQDQLQPDRSLGRNQAFKALSREHLAHGHGEDGRRQNQANPETTGHVD